MRIGVDCTFASRTVTGMERYAASLCAALRRADTHHQFIDLDPRLPRPLEKRLGGKVKRFLTEQYTLGAAAAKAQLDLMFYPAFPPGPLSARPFAMIVYDAVPWLYRDTMGLRGKWYMGPLVRRAVRRTAAILTISKAVTSELASLLPRGGAEIAYVGGGVDASPAPCRPRERAATLARLGLRSPFLLAVGSLEPRKNYPALFRAMRLVGAGSEAQLAVAGRWAWASDELRRLAEEEGGRIEILGYVSDADLAVLYDAAECCLQASLYEGLGLPVLEALSHGLPVVASDIPVFREIGAERVHLVDFGDPAQVAQRVLWLLKNPRERARSRAAALSLAAEYNWDAAAARALAVFDRLESSARAGAEIRYERQPAA
ncbi:MAG: glycosyltransferase family 4 protein [Bryobacteraceae bacterium]